MNPKEYELEYFKTNKFHRKQCPICKKHFHHRVKIVVINDTTIL